MKAHGPGESPVLLLEIVTILNKFHIPYAVIGAMAASFYGAVRASIDADALIFLKENDATAEKLITELKSADFKVIYRRGDLDDPLLGIIHVSDQHHNQVDLLLGIRGMKEDVLSRTIRTPFLKSELQMIGLEDFIAMKIFAGGPQDIQDAKDALKISAEKINHPLLKELVLNYGKKELKRLEAILKENH